MTNRFLFLSEEDIHFLLDNDLDLVLDSIKDAVVLEHQGKALQPDKISEVFEEKNQNRINCMPAAVGMTYGMKWVSVFPSNHSLGLRNVEGFTILSELETGGMKCVLNSTICTSYRTAAIGSVSSKYLSPNNPKSIGFIGAGEEAKAHLIMLKHVHPELEKCYISSRTEERVKKTISELKDKVRDIEYINCGSDFKAAVIDSDIIVTAISSQAEVLKADWIKPGMLYIHVAGLEDEFGVAKKADKIVCDSWECVKHRSQTIAQMYEKNLLSDDDIYADIAEIILGEKAGRETDEEFIYFNSVGMAVEDVLLAERIYQKAIKNNIGKWIEK